MKKNLYLLLLVLVCAGQHILAQTNTWYTFPSNLFEAANRYIYVDSNDVKWVGSYDSGIHRFGNGQWNRFDMSNSPITDDDVRQSCFDTAGNLWMATWNKLNKYDTATGTWTSFNVTGQLLDILYSVQVDNANRVWVGTDGGTDADDGLYMYDGTNWTFYNPTNSPLTGRWILQIKKDRTGKLWACHYGGLLEINGTTISNHLLTTAGFPVNTSVSAVDFDSYNNKWVAVYDGGIGKFDGTNWTIYNSTNSPLPENKIWSIAVDHDNVVWIGTENEGLVKFDGTNWTVYNTTTSVLTSNRIDALAVDQLNNVWIAPSYGGIVVHNPGALSGISGTVYNDVNGNHVRDTGEPALPNEIMRIDSTLFTSISNSTGNYYCAILNEGSYTAKLANTSPYILDVFPDSINFSITASATNLPGRDFGVQLIPGINDVAVDITSVNIPRPGFPYVLNVQVKNRGSVLAEDIRVKLKYNTNLILDSVSLPSIVQQADSIVWLLDSLAVFDQQSIKVYFHLPPNPGLLGLQLNSTASAYSNNADVDSSNNIRVGYALVVGSYDPNDKQVDPKGVGATGAISVTTDSLTYTIRFQNTGTASAINIIVKDTIDTDLDIATFSMISSSHPYSVSLKNPNIITWTFNNINLPDSNSNSPASNGYIKYNIKLKPGLAQGTQLTNTAHIYFDFNPAVLTNEVLNTIDDVVVPLGLSSLAANCNEETPVLLWRTELEPGIKNFGIETSADGLNWTLVGTVEPKGDNSDYRFKDPVRTHALYRLCITGIDGEKTYSEIVNSNCGNSHTFTVYPVPAVNDLYVKAYSNEQTNVAFEIIDVSAKIALRETKELQAGMNNISLDISTLSAGKYFVRMIGKAGIVVQKIVVLK